MNPIHIKNSRLIGLIPSKPRAITLYPFILYSGDPMEETVAHEMIHVSQVKQIGFFRFYVSYIFYYLAGLLEFGDHYMAYSSIPYETEAYYNEDTAMMILSSDNYTEGVQITDLLTNRKGVKI